ncbi:MAG: peptidase dimerization domain-containing protein [Bacilli bacterium]
MSPDESALCVGVRGFCGLLVEVEGPAADLHSGGYGGLVHNPAHALARLLASLYDEDGRVAVANFYKDVEEVPMNERARLRQATPPDGGIGPTTRCFRVVWRIGIHCVGSRLRG